MDQERTEKPVLEGTVSSIIFQNEENGYTILRLDAGEEEMTVVGSMPGVSPGEYLTVRGSGCATPPTAPSSGLTWWSAACPRA